MAEIANTQPKFDIALDKLDIGECKDGDEDNCAQHLVTDEGKLMNIYKNLAQTLKNVPIIGRNSQERIVSGMELRSNLIIQRSEVMSVKVAHNFREQFYRIFVW